jgi:hypothetical protein
MALGPLTILRMGYGPAMTADYRPSLEAFLGELLQRRAAETVATRYRRLRVLYRWLEEEEEIPASPMARMKPPIVPDQPVPVVPEDGLRRHLQTDPLTTQGWWGGIPLRPATAASAVVKHL